MNTHVSLKSKSIAPDEWLSAVLKRNVYRVSMDEEFKAACRQAEGVENLVPEGRAFLYAKVPAGDVENTIFLETQGFYLIDTNLLFSKLFGLKALSKPGIQIRFAEAHDENKTAELARRSFSWSRFHRDPAIGVEAAHFLKAEWVRNYFKGKRGEAMILAKKNAAVIGFLQLLKTGKILAIDLIAVDPNERGQGVAEAMIAFAEASFPGCDQIQAGTQAVNIPSVNLYERLGFRLVSSSVIFHRHLEGARK